MNINRSFGAPVTLLSSSRSTLVLTCGSNPSYLVKLLQVTAPDEADSIKSKAKRQHAVAKILQNNLDTKLTPFFDGYISLIVTEEDYPSAWKKNPNIAKELENWVDFEPLKYFLFRPLDMGVESIGSSLNTYIQNTFQKENSPVDYAMVASIAFQLTLALSAAQHDVGLIHNDVKMDNIVLRPQQQGKASKEINLNGDTFLNPVHFTEYQLSLIDFDASVVIVDLTTLSPDVLSFTPMNTIRTPFHTGWNYVRDGKSGAVRRGYSADCMGFCNVLLSVMMHNRFLFKKKNYTVSKDFLLTGYNAIAPLAKDFPKLLSAFKKKFQSLLFAELIIFSFLFEELNVSWGNEKEERFYLEILEFSKQNITETNPFTGLVKTIEFHFGADAIDFIKLLALPTPEERGNFGLNEVGKNYMFANALYHPFIAKSTWKYWEDVKNTKDSLTILNPLGYRTDSESNVIRERLHKENNDVENEFDPESRSEEEEEEEDITDENEEEAQEQDTKVPVEQVKTLLDAFLTQYVRLPAPKLDSAEYERMAKQFLYPLHIALNSVTQNKGFVDVIKAIAPDAMDGDVFRFPSYFSGPGQFDFDQAQKTPSGMITVSNWDTVEGLQKVLPFVPLVNAALVFSETQSIFSYIYLPNKNAYEGLKDLQTKRWQKVVADYKKLLQPFKVTAFVKSSIHDFLAMKEYCHDNTFHLESIKDDCLIPLFHRLEHCEKTMPAFETIQAELKETPLEQMNFEEQQHVFDRLALLQEIL